jgi:hypothetical protein
VDLIVKLLLKTIIRWINTHPDSVFSRFMPKQHGPRTDVARMNRVQRLASALAFLFWGFLFLGVWLLIGYVTFGLGVLSPDDGGPGDDLRLGTAGRVRFHRWHLPPSPGAHLINQLKDLRRFAAHIGPTNWSESAPARPSFVDIAGQRANTTRRFHHG